MLLGITRPPEQLKGIDSFLKEKGVELIPLPVTSINYLDFQLPVDYKLNEIDWIFFSSANGVRAFFKRLNNLKFSLDLRTKLAAVGDITGEILDSYNQSVDFIPTKSYGKALFEQFINEKAKENEVVIYARAKSISFDPSELFAQKSISYIPVNCYETVEQNLSPEQLVNFKKSDKILFTAASTVTFFQKQHGQPKAKPIAIGKSTASEMIKQGWSDFITMEKPDIKSVLEYL